eukprot:SAG22_NODE_14_length_33165_cov_13.196698_14_plen_98_part_00
MAWALSQTYIVGFEGFAEREIECWQNYYDIFVRNAFTNLRAVLREVAYSPAMGIYLTFKGGSAYFVNNNWPDENFAREMMQVCPTACLVHSLLLAAV